MPETSDSPRPILQLVLGLAQLAALVVAVGLFFDHGVGIGTLGMAVVTFALFAAGSSLRRAGGRR